MSKLSRIIFLMITLILCLVLNSQAQTPDKVATYQDENGWKLLVNGEDYYVKGVVWGYTPIGENYSYNLWAHSDEYVKKVLDYECELMKKAGINTIRSFGMIPPKWVTYIYEEHGIMSIVNHLMGRYGYNVGGVWKPFTDYSDELTRETLKKDIADVVRKYKDTPGVLMFALGNESNYGLEWSSFEIENLPEGERHKEKAKSLYSLFNEVIQEGKKIDKNHPFTIVNGDVQYLDLIKEYCTELDLLGVNAYRGVSFTDLWENVDQKLDLPVLFMEFGSDAFNARDNMEDQEGQARLLYGQWKEIYNKSYGKGEEGNAIGGFVFEWRDEWWKYLQVEDLDIQNNHASWANGGYTFDYVEGKNNMNEEWFGICGLRGPNEDGVYQAHPRMAYYMLAEIFEIDPYTESKTEINNKLNNIDMELLAVESDVRLLKDARKQYDAFKLTGGRFEADLVLKGRDKDIEMKGKNGLGFTHGEMMFLDFKFQPFDRLTGTFTLNILNNVADKDMEQVYGMRGLPITITTKENQEGVIVNTETVIEDNERIEIYDFEATYSGEKFDFTTFYHVPRYHWGYEGDFYGLMYEATDMEGMDIWNAKAPFGVEIASKNPKVEGFRLVMGPEVYWGANPKAILKYNFNMGRFKYSFMHSEDIARAGASATATEATERATRKTTLYLKTDVIPRTTLELGGIMASTEKVDDEFDYVDDDGNIVKDKIEFSDTFGGKAKITINAVRGLLYGAINYAGLVADGGSPFREFDTQLPYSALGNKIVYEGGYMLNLGNIMIYPRGFYRENLLEANPIIEPYTSGTILHPGINPRDRENDPFAVLDNRKAISGELFFTYDPTPASSFYAWDSDKKEDSKFAFNIGVNATQYEKPTDSHLFFYLEGNTNAPFGKGLPAEDVWLAKSRIVMNPNPKLKIITNLSAGFQQSTGAPDGDTQEYYGMDGKIKINNKHILSYYVKKDDWGPYDWYRQFNITYPYQYKLDYSVLIDNFMDELKSSKLGIKALYRTLDENSPGDEYNHGENEYMFEISTYYNLEF